MASSSSSSSIWPTIGKFHRRSPGKQPKHTKPKYCAHMDWDPVKAVPLQQLRRLRERRYSSYSFTTSALDGGEWSASRPGRALPPGKGPPIPIVQEVRWAAELVWTQRLEEKSFRLCRGSNLYRLVVQPVVRHYTDWATPAHIDTQYMVKFWRQYQLANVSYISRSSYEINKSAHGHVSVLHRVYFYVLFRITAITKAGR
jgi:hypothetical protein